ncbi:MAG: sctJ-A [Chlamydiales bacterium]|nr:sctJ-A [Chlamydiales bacterium]
MLSKMRSLTSLMLFALAALALTACEQKKAIVNGLDEKEANEIVVFLAGHGIESTKTAAPDAGGGGNKGILWDVTVSKEKSVQAMAILSANGLPKKRGLNLLNLFSASGLVPSEMQEKIKYQAGLAEQIAGIIRKIDGILDADIQLSIPEEDALGLPNAEKGKVTASVYVKHQGVMDDPNSHLITKIKRLVASSIPGLEFDNVTVITDRARFAESMAQEKPKDVQWMKVWGMLVAKESLGLFRVVFFSFCLLVLSLALSLVWVTWKIFPLLSSVGGLPALFHLQPLDSRAKALPAAEGEKEKATKEGKLENNLDQKVD